MAGSSDIWELVKSGLSLFASVAEAYEKQKIGKPYSAHAAQATSELINIAQTLSRMAQNSQPGSPAVSLPSLQLQPVRFTALPSLRFYNMGGKWKSASGDFFASVHDNDTGKVMFGWPRISGNGLNLYVGAATADSDSASAIVSGSNSIGQFIVMLAFACGDTLLLRSWNKTKNVVEEATYYKDD